MEPATTALNVDLQNDLACFVNRMVWPSGSLFFEFKIIVNLFGIDASNGEMAGAAARKILKKFRNRACNFFPRQLLYFNT